MTEPLPGYPENIATDYVSQRHLDRAERMKRAHEQEEKRRWASFARYLERENCDLGTGIDDLVAREQVEADWIA